MERPSAPSPSHAAAPVAIARARSPHVALPSPFAPEATLALYKARLGAAFSGASPRVCGAFWLFGLINNVLYVIILSAALDLVGPALPKSIVLLADVLPSLLTKMSAPYFVHLLPYRLRVVILVALSFTGMQLVAWADALPARLCGVVLASISSGLGELSFLAMTHFYGRFAIPFWGSGTGAAGLLGAAMYVTATTGLGFTERQSLMAFGFLPAIMLVAFFGILPMAPLRGKAHGYEPLGVEEEEEPGTEEEEGAGLLGQRSFGKQPVTELGSFKAKLRRSAHLFFPYMLPLLLVYIAEYTINLGVAPTLLFPLTRMPFAAYRDAYPMYNTLYQAGVFISRSSTPFIRVPYLYPCSLLQVLNLFLLVSHALYDWIPNIWLIFAIIFWEGLLGGAVYVNTFTEITETFEGEAREFALGTVTVGDSGGICIAGFIGLWLEGALCGWQVKRGRDYCTLT